MFGFFQTVFYFGYMAVFSVGLGLVCGTMGKFYYSYMAVFSVGLGLDCGTMGEFYFGYFG